MRRAYCTSLLPSDVRLITRPLRRLNRLLPIWASSLAICWLTVDCERPTLSAVRETLMVSATTMNERRQSISKFIARSIIVKRDIDHHDYSFCHFKFCG